MAVDDSAIQRHKTAIRRNRLSRPVALLVEKGLINQELHFFDYGCGHGQDLDILKQNGLTNISGHDPHYKPDPIPANSDIVNLGYVINVIENPKERADVLKKAYAITKKVLCVSAMLENQKGYEGESFTDGVKTKTGTFQKYYNQVELKNYIESVLGEDTITLHQGIFLVFKNEKDKIEYLEKKYRRNVVFEITKIDPITNELRKVRVFKPKLEELIKDSPFFKSVLDFVLAHGRLPVAEESSDYCQLLEEFKSKNKISSLVINNIDSQELENIRKKRRDDLLVIFALRRFTKRGLPKQRDLPISTLHDIRSFFGGYKQFLGNAEALLFALGDEAQMVKALNSVSIGKILPDAVYIHPSYVKDLPPVVRVKVGVAEALIGDVDGHNLIKINKTKDKVSFLVYEDFDEVEHPALMFSYVVNIPKAQIKEWDFTTRENPPILHRKETFVSPDYPMYQKFKELSEAEEKLGLLGHDNIGTMLKWEEFLLSKGLIILDHSIRRITRGQTGEGLQVTN